MKNTTNLGTLARVLNILKTEGIVDIPETAEAFELAFSIVVELDTEKLTELLLAIDSTLDTGSLSDEGAIKVLQDFFINLGDRLSLFVRTLTREFVEQKNLAIQKMSEMLERQFSETITGTNFDSLLSEALEKQ